MATHRVLAGPHRLPRRGRGGRGTARRQGGGDHLGRLGDRHRRGGARDLVRRARVRRLHRAVPARRDRHLPRRGDVDARDPRLEGGRPGRRGQRAGRGGGRPWHRGRERGAGRGRGRLPGVPHRRGRDDGRDPADGRDLPAARDLPLGQPGAVHPVSGRGWLPRGYRMAALQGRAAGRLRHEPADRTIKIRGSLRARALGPRRRVRRDPADRDPRRAALTRDPGRPRVRARAVRDRDARHGVLHPGRSDRAVAAGTVHLDAAVATVDPARARRRRLDRGPRPGRRHRHHGVGGRDGVPVQRRRRRVAAAHRSRFQPRSSATRGW